MTTEADSKLEVLQPGDMVSFTSNAGHCEVLLILDVLWIRENSRDIFGGWWNRLVRYRILDTISNRLSFWETGSYEGIQIFRQERA